MAPLGLIGKYLGYEMIFPQLFGEANYIKILVGDTKRNQVEIEQILCNINFEVCWEGVEHGSRGLQNTAPEFFLTTMGAAVQKSKRKPRSRNE